MTHTTSNIGHVKRGDLVSWKWAAGTASGTVVDVEPDTITVSSKGKKITRNGTPDNLAVVIENDQGARILKLESELHRGTLVTT